jgi:hypothetical protein
MDIWNMADLYLLRTTLNHVIHAGQSRNVAIDMEQVKYVPSGFFGMLFDCHELGVSVQLLAPQPQVKRMIWFRQFFGEVGEGNHVFLREPRQVLASEFPSDDSLPLDPACGPSPKVNHRNSCAATTQPVLREEFRR